jgi:hypothetical protein
MIGRPTIRQYRTLTSTFRKVADGMNVRIGQCVSLPDIEA